MKRVTVLSVAAAAAFPAFGQEVPSFDGIYRYVDAPEELCGDDFGRVVIENGKFHGLENDCLLSEPKPIPEVNAVLFNAICSGEGMEDQHPLMLKHSDDGVVHGIYPDWIVEWVRCK